MTKNLQTLGLILVLAPLLGSLISGLLGNIVGDKNSHRFAITGLFVSFISACLIAKLIVVDNNFLNQNLYTWGVSGSFNFHLGFLLDRLTAVMIIIVTFVSLLVHIYSIGYMAGDPGYSRFFAYMSLFTFSMLMLVTANNFLQMFFGWEGVGLVSYLLIGFWYSKESASLGSIKAFIVNRVADIAFVLAMGAVLDNFNTLDFATIFQNVTQYSSQTINLLQGHSWSLITFICILLLIGAMGKSAQMPLHVWLPESMEGPTPISALIHAATMVTAGVFMIARMSPLFEQSAVALNLVLIIGATTAFFTGLVALVQNDIKRVVAYSTLSQLGYMVAAAGVSAYSASVFHLLTHAFFKALLFLGAGSVIVAMHHEQDMRHMGGLKKALPITYITFLIGALALSAFPPFAGFYSKDAIIEMVEHSTLPAAQYSYYCVLAGAFITSLYIFRAFFLTFHGQQRFDAKHHHVKESPWVICLPLVLLAICSIISGFYLVKPILGEQFFIQHGIFIQSPTNPTFLYAHEYLNPLLMASNSWEHLSFWLSIGGILTAWICYVVMPNLPALFAARLSIIYKILLAKYGFDDFNQFVFVRGTRNLAGVLYRLSDAMLIDDWMINGSGRLIGFFSRVSRKLQTGLLYHYIWFMLLGLVVLMLWIIYQ